MRNLVLGDVGLIGFAVLLRILLGICKGEVTKQSFKNDVTQSANFENAK